MYETYVRPFLPDLGPRSIKTAVCLYTNAPGARFVIDTHPEHEHVIFASPCSGHGFKHSAAIGEALADRLRNCPPKVDLSPFEPVWYSVEARRCRNTASHGGLPKPAEKKEVIFAVRGQRCGLRRA
jgi:glycine/D-amino acid oxidase-like deaminating enzyme